jgi:hypothetical protein
MICSAFIMVKFSFATGLFSPYPTTFSEKAQGQIDTAPGMEYNKEKLPGGVYYATD